MAAESNPFNYLEQTVQNVTDWNAISEWYQNPERQISGGLGLTDYLPFQQLRPEAITDAVKALPIEVKDAVVEHDALGKVSGSVYRLQRGETTAYHRGFAFAMTITKPGVVMRSSKLRGWYPLLKLEDQDSYKPRAVSVGRIFAHKVVKTMTRPEAGGIVILKRGLGFTALEGIVDPETAEPRVTLRVIELNDRKSWSESHTGGPAWRGETDPIEQTAQAQHKGQILY